MPITAEAPFDFDNLIEVRPMTVTATVGRRLLMIDSIERYTHGFVLVLWSEQTRHDPQLLSITATDDQGGRYSGMMLAGAGGGGDSSFTERIVYSFTPALNPAARSITLDITAVPTLRIDAISGSRVEQAGVFEGPWKCQFDLSTADEIRQRVAGFTLPRASRMAPSAPEPTGTVAGEVCPPHLGPQTLQRVIPVAQRAVAEDYEIAILSLEIHNEGFSLIARTDYPKPFVQHAHRWDWNINDGQGGSYRSWGIAGSGGGIPGKTTSWRIDCTMSPALPTDIRRLKLSLADLRLKEQTAEPWVIHGPWEFDIQL